MATAVLTVLALAVFVLVNLVTRSAAKRGKRPVVNPIVIGSVEFRAPNTVETEGCVEAWDTMSKKMLWRQKVYHRLWIPLLEEDNQWNFIKSMTIGATTNELVIVNEEGGQFNLNTSSRKIVRRKGSLLRGW